MISVLSTQDSDVPDQADMIIDTTEMMNNEEEGLYLVDDTVFIDFIPEQLGYSVGEILEYE